MWNAFDLESVEKLLPLARPDDNASIVELEELLEHQHGQKLRLGDLGARVVIQCVLAGLQSPYEPTRSSVLLFLIYKAYRQDGQAMHHQSSVE